MSYQAPVDDILAALKSAADLDALNAFQSAPLTLYLPLAKVAKAMGIERT